MSSIILIRHGESLGNANEDYYKLPDVANILSQKGVDQCMELSHKIKDYMCDDFHGVHTTVIASKFQRAQLTAQIVMSSVHLQHPIIVDHRINEMYHCARGVLAEDEDHLFARVRSLVESHHFNLILFTHGMLMGALEPEKGWVNNCDIRKYDRKDFLERILRSR